MRSNFQSSVYDCRRLSHSVHFCCDAAFVGKVCLPCWRITLLAGETGIKTSQATFVALTDSGAMAAACCDFDRLRRDSYLLLIELLGCCGLMVSGTVS